MKKSFKSTIIAFFIVCNIINAQNNNWCGTKSTPEFELFRLKPSNYTIPEKVMPTYNLPIQFWSVGKGDGKCSNYYPVSKILDNLCELNQQFLSVGFHFYFYDLKYICDNNFFSYSSSGNGRSDMMNIYSTPNVINVYIPNSVTGICGRANFPPVFEGLEIIASGGCLNPGSSTFAHEMGHWFALPHTFSGWEGLSCSYSSPSCPTQNMSCFPSNVEYVNSTPNNAISKYDCNKQGDGFCDTPADYLPNIWNCSYKCSYTDPDGQKISPDGKFIMSYSNNCSSYIFSNEQINGNSKSWGMVEILLDNFAGRKFLLNHPAPKKDVITKAPNLIFPNNDTVPEDYIVFRWSKVTSATKYNITVKYFTTIVMDIVTADTFFVTTLNLIPSHAIVKNKSYKWTVKAMTEGAVCTGLNLSLPISFFVSNPTGVNAIQEIEKFVIYPNPAQQNKKIMGDIFAKSNLQTEIELYNVTGQLLKSIPFFMTNGNNHFELNTENLTSGLYLIRIKAAENSILQKITISE